MESVYLLAAAVSGLLLGISFPPVGLWFLSFFALVPLLWSFDNTRHLSLSYTLRLAAIFAISFMGSYHSWILQLTAFAPTWGVVLLFIAAIVFFSLYYVVCLGVARYFSKWISWPIALWCCWIIMEYLRQFGPLASTGGAIGYSISGISSLRQLSAIGGVPLLSAVVLLINFNMYGLARSKYRLAAISGIITLHLVALGWFIHNSPLPIPTIPVSIIQPNHEQHFKMDNRHTAQIHTDIIHLATTAANSSANPQIIVAPETITPWFNLHSYSFIFPMSKLLYEHPTTFIFGTPTKENGLIYNSVISAYVDHHQLQTSRSSKKHLMPFGEYWPQRSLLEWLNLGDITAGADYTASTRYELLNIGTANIKAGSLVCLEATYPNIAHEFSRQGASLFVVLANNAWFFSSSAAAKLLQFSQIRAVETKRWVIQSANTGISAIIAPDGRIVSALGLNQKGILNGYIAPITDTTFYTRYGDVFVIIVIAFLITIRMRVLFQTQKNPSSPNPFLKRLRRKSY